MGYRIRYEARRRISWYWALLPVAAGVVMLSRQDGWYETIVRYVGAAIRAH